MILNVINVSVKMSEKMSSTSDLVMRDVSRITSTCDPYLNPNRNL